MKRRYAQNTKVGVEASRSEIERTLHRFGATGFIYGWQEDHAMVAFVVNERQVKFLLPLPSPHDTKFKFTEARKTRRSDKQQYALWEQATKERWRSLSMAIKSRLVSVEDGIKTHWIVFLKPNARTELRLPDSAATTTPKI